MPQELTEFQKEQIARMKDQEEKEMAENAELIQNFKLKCTQLGINSEKIKFDYRMKTGIVAVYPNLLSYLNPELEKDKDGLVSLSDLTKYYDRQFMSHGYFHDADYAVMASHFFRRGMYKGNGYAPRLIEYIGAIEDKNLVPAIKIEFNEVRIDQSGTFIELDTWYGATFDRNVEDIKDGNVKLVPPPCLDQTDLKLFFNNTIALNIEWRLKTEDNKTFKNFQAEEFKTEDTLIEYNDNIYHPTHYLHSEYNLKDRCFRHLDGAVHFYSTEDYQQVRYSDFKYNDKNNKQVKGASLKLFRIDGALSIDSWMEYVSQFLTGNPLVFEYFEGKLPDRIQNLANLKSQ